MTLSAANRDEISRRPSSGLARASLAATLAVMRDVVLPTVAKGVVKRRPRIVAAAQALDLDLKAIRCLQRLRATYGDGPVILNIPLRTQAVVLAAADAHRVLEGTPAPFSPASSEKRAALAHFEPRNSLVSTGPEREARRAVSERALEPGRTEHSLRRRFADIAEEEFAALVPSRDGRIDWASFAPAWARLTRRVVLGEGASEDHETTDVLAALRDNANWAFLKPTDTALRARFHARLATYLQRPEPESLIAHAGLGGTDGVIAAGDQVAQWLFAFDPAGMATFRALVLLAAHPNAQAAARANALREEGASPVLRAAILESVRLWPTTPAILRQTTEDTDWPGGTLPKGAGILVFTPFFHRDDERLQEAHRFAPELWAGGAATDAPLGLVPFSAGPAMCPARHLVPMVGALVLGVVLRRSRQIELGGGARLDPARPLPGTLDPFALSIALSGPNARGPM